MLSLTIYGWFNAQPYTRVTCLNNRNNVNLAVCWTVRHEQVSLSLIVTACAATVSVSAARLNVYSAINKSSCFDLYPYELTSFVYN